MSDKLITKKVQSTICDFCDHEINKIQDNYCYHDVNRRSADTPELERDRKFNPVHFILSLGGRNKYGLSIARTRYDFHAECFDILMRKFLDEKIPK